MPPIIVVGMHRSGTSFVASLLQAAGVDMGSRLMPAARGNERGHFENMDFVEFHMRELRLTGHDDAGWTTQHPIVLGEGARAEARSILESNARDGAWGWKDPRTTLFLDFWLSLIPDAHFLYIYREPSEVIDSLYRRGDESIQATPELAARAYLTHNGIMLEHARKHRNKSIVAQVSAIARGPQAFLALVAERFGENVLLDAPSTFESELMKTAADDPRAALLRHHLPEMGRLYDELELEADFPSGSTVAISKRRLMDAFFYTWMDDARNITAFRDEAREKAAALVRSEEGSAARAAYLEAAERDLFLEHAAREAGDASIKELSQRIADLHEQFEKAAHELEAQTRDLILATRAESEKIALLISTVQSSSFWKIKRGLNRLRGPR